MVYLTICLVCFVALVALAVYTCAKVTQGTSFADTFRRIGSSVQLAFNAGYDQYKRSKSREYQFHNLVLAAQPFSLIIAEELHLCKRCRLWEHYSINEDIYYISFKLLGITTHSDATELKELLATELQEVYARHFGQIYPLVYAVGFEQNVVSFWVAMNCYGNDLIRQRVNSDYYADVKELEVLEDD